MYTKCSYTFPSGAQCSNPVALYITPPLCGGHCDNIDLSLPEKRGQDTVTEAQAEAMQSITEGDGRAQNCDSVASDSVRVEKTGIDIQR